MNKVVGVPFSLDTMQEAYRGCDDVPQVMLAGRGVFAQLWLRVHREDRDPRDGPLSQLGWRTVRWNRAEVVEWSGVGEMTILFVSQKAFRQWVVSGRSEFPETMLILQMVDHRDAA